MEMIFCLLTGETGHTPANLDQECSVKVSGLFLDRRPDGVDG